MTKKNQALGGFKDRRNGEAVNRVYSYERAFRSGLQDVYSEAVEHQRLYLSYRKDHRKPWEKKWRAFTLQPYPWVIIEGKIAAMTDVLNSGDPLVQAEGINDDDIIPARKAEKMLDGDLRANRWRLKAENILREAAVLGTTAVKVTWKHQQTKVMERDPNIEKGFKEFSKIHKAATGEEVPQNPEEYEEWKAEQSERFGVAARDLPEHPGRVVRPVTTFKGPSIDRVSLFDVRYDPLVPEWRNQPMIIQRIVKPKKWVLDLAGSDPSLPFDEESVKMAIEALPEDRLLQWQQEQATMLGLGNAISNWPITKDYCELWEVWDHEDEEHPYKVILNRFAVINKDTQGMPYGFGTCPVSLIRNVPQANTCIGISDLKAPKGLFRELWTLRDLRLDAVTLAALGVYTKINEMGIPDVAKVLKPGMSIPVSRQDAIKRLDLGGVHPDVWREIPELKQEIDDATSVPTNLRGMPATVGRVSASESGQRHSSALSRIKAAATRFEEELYEPLKQMLYLRYKNTDPEEIIKLAGGSGDYAQMNREELRRAIDMDFHLRGPSKSLNKEMQTQQLMQFFGTFGPILPPHKQLILARETYEVMGLRGGDKIISDEEVKMAEEQSAQPPAPPPGGEGAPQDPNAQPAPEGAAPAAPVQ
jgi:hypothetical protein